MNLKGHSGYFSCPKCLITGEKSARTGNVMVFPHEENLELRTVENYKECVKNAVLTKKHDRGVCGPTILSYMVYCFFLRSTSIDSMHCLFMGIVKQLLKLWFDPKYSEEPFSLAQFVDKVNGRLKRLNLPHFVQRLPEDITNLHFWKASLCRNFLMYFALVVLKDIMKPEYFANFCQLVEGSAILHKSSISQADITFADQLLNQFSKDFQNLYGLRHMSSNIHLLGHLSLSALDCGNLCIASCYKLEDLNGKMSSLVHGTTHVTKQIFSNLSVLSELPLLVSQLLNVNAKSFCTKVINRGKYLNFLENIARRVYVVGCIHAVTKHKEKNSELCGVNVQFRTFSQLYKHNMLFSSSSYSKGSRISSFCKYRCAEGVYHDQILSFVKTCENDPQYFAYILRSDENPCDLERYVIFSSFHECTDLISVMNLICVSFYLQVENVSYLVDPLNRYEME